MGGDPEEDFLSYIYCGKGLTVRAGPQAILAYEPLSNHDGKKMNVLFADGHVQGLPLAQAMILLRNLNTVTTSPTTVPSQ